MKYIITLFTYLLAIVPTFAQQDITIPFVAHWETGKTHTFNITKKKEKIENGKVIDFVLNTYQLKWTVLEAKDEEYILEWKCDKNFIKQITANDSLGDQLIDQFNDIKIKYKTNELGVFKEIIDFEDLKIQMEEIKKITLKFYSGNNSLFDDKLQTLMSVFSSKEGISHLILKEIQSFHFPLGIEIGIMDTIFYDDQISNLITNQYMKAQGKFYFKSVDLEKSTAKFINELKVDKDDARKSIEYIMKVLSSSVKVNNKKEKKEFEKQIQDEINNMTIDISDYDDYNYNFKESIPIKIHTKRTNYFKVTGKTKINTEEVIIEWIQ